MTKFFCDQCKKEILDQNQGGSFQIIEKTVLWEKHQKQDAVQNTKYLLCVECAGKIKDIIKKGL